MNLIRLGSLVSLVLVLAWVALYQKHGPAWEKSAFDAAMQAAMQGEWRSVQTNFDAMLYENEPVGLKPHDTSRHRPVNDWSSQPQGNGAVPLSYYLSKGIRTHYYYCWDASGELTGLYQDATLTCADPPERRFERPESSPVSWEAVLEEEGPPGY